MRSTTTGMKGTESGASSTRSTRSARSDRGSRMMKSTSSRGAHTSSARSVAMSSGMSVGTGGPGHHNDAVEDEVRPLQLLDADGNDVTPRSLINPEVTLHSDLLRQRLSNEDTNSGTAKGNFGLATVARQSHSLLGGRKKKLGGKPGQSTMGDADAMTMPFTRSFVATSMRSMTSSNNSNMGGMESDGDNLVSGISDVKTYHAKTKQAPVEIPEEELDNPVDIKLTETDIIWMFDQPSTVVGGGTEEAEEVEAVNAQYDKVLEEYDVNHDAVATRFAQTMHLADKNKDCQVSAVEMASVGCSASEANIYDTYAALDDDNDNDGGQERATTAGTAYSEAGVQADAEEADTKSSPMVQVNELARRFDSLQGDASFATLLKLTERVVVHADSQCASGQRLYKGVAPVAPAVAPDADASAETTEPVGVTDTATTATEDTAATDADPGSGAVEASPEADTADKDTTNTSVTPRFEKLWRYHCTLTEGRAVTAVVWNKANSDILAAGYGTLDQSGVTVEGLVCCWSFKNPQYPEKVFRLKSGVCSVAFSSQWPSLIAVGCHDGTIAIFDVSADGTEPLVSSTPLPFESKHTSAVWGLDFVAHDSGRTTQEVLMSTAMDGKVVKWVLSHKGLSSQQLIQLKRTKKQRQAAASKAGHTAYMAILSSCLSMDFRPSDSSQYIVGTEDGVIHKCSCSYNEQTIHDYMGHEGPVNAVQWSPFAPGVFVTCSADWTMRVWEEGSEDALKVVTTGSHTISDCVWSPTLSTVLATTDDAGLAVWDFAVEELDPVVTVPCENGAKGTVVSFGASAQTVAFGDTGGSVTVGMLQNIGGAVAGQRTDEEQANILLELLTQSGSTQ
eukprot:m.116234 g.116234  ORF g.116234 m.116234 type:complete len:848 (+) comp10912_c0_seq2:144-2687(+)